MNKLAVGYIASHPFWDEAYLPQRVQNQLVRLHCENNKLTLVWSLPEVSHGYIETPALENFLKTSEEKIEAMVFISYQMNEPTTIIKNAKKIIRRSIEIHFALENCRIKTENDLERLSQEIILSKSLKSKNESPLMEMHKRKMERRNKIQ